MRKNAGATGDEDAMNFRHAISWESSGERGLSGSAQELASGCVYIPVLRCSLSV